MDLKVITKLENFKPAVLERVQEILQDGDAQAQRLLARKMGITSNELHLIQNEDWRRVSHVVLQKACAYFELMPYWRHLDTPNFRLIEKLLSHAKTTAKLCGIDGNTGRGKSYALRHVTHESDSTIRVICRESMSKKDFLVELASQVNVRHANKTRYEIEKNIAIALGRMDYPLVLIDEIENLRLESWASIKCLVDLTERRCSFVLVGLDVYEIIRKNADKGKNPFRQLARRFPAQNFAFLGDIEADDMRDTVVSFGITDGDAVQWFIDNVEDYGTLQNVVMHALKIAEKKEQEITRVFLAEYFGDTRPHDAMRVI